MIAAAVIPVKRFDAAKQRLADSLRPTQRRALAEAMLEDVLGAVSRCCALEQVFVVTGEPAAERAARAAGARLVLDRLDSGHSQAALLGVTEALDAGVERCALLPGDCPLLDPIELEAALAGMPAESVSVVPDRHGTGTNGLLLWPPDAIEPAFGEGSRARHEARARAAGRRVTVERIPSLALDVDGPADLAELRDVLEHSAERAPRTAGALEAIRVESVAGDAAA